MNILSYNNDTFKITCNRVVLSYIIPDSSMVEHTAVNRGVVGSSPTRGVMATQPSGMAEVCNTFITSSNLVVASNMKCNPFVRVAFFILDAKESLAILRSV